MTLLAVHLPQGPEWGRGRSGRGSPSIKVPRYLIQHFCVPKLMPLARESLPPEVDQAMSAPSTRLVPECGPPDVEAMQAGSSPLVQGSGPPVDQALQAGSSPLVQECGPPDVAVPPVDQALQAGSAQQNTTQED
jgi:hypothetical protein